MLQATLKSFGLAVGLLSVSMAQESRVRDALVYPPLIAEVRVWFEIDPAALEGVFGGESIEKRIARLRRQVEQKPNDADAWLQLARAYEKSTPSDDEADAKKEAMLRDEAFRRAEALYRQRLEQSPDNPTLMARLADALRGTGKLSEAQTLARKAVQLDSRNPEHWEVAGRVALAAALEKIFGNSSVNAYFVDICDTKLLREATPHLREARDAYEQCLQRAPSHRDALLELAQVEVWETLLSASTEDKEAFEARMQRMQQRAFNLLQQAPHGTEVVLTTVLLMHAVNRLAGDNLAPEASRRFQQGLETLQRAVLQQVEAAYQKAEGRQRADLGFIRVVLRYLDAPEEPDTVVQLLREVFQTLYALEPDNPKWRLGLIAMITSRDRWDEVEQLARAALQRQPDPDWNHWLIVALDKQGKLDEANRAIEAFYREFPDTPQAMLFRSLQLMRTQSDPESLQQAGALIRAAARLLNPSPEASIWAPLETIRAAHLALTGSPGEARALLQQVRQHYPDWQFAQRLEQALRE